MLQLFAEDLDICRIGKMLGKYNIASTITSSTISIYCDELPVEVATTILESSTITYAQNHSLSNTDALNSLSTRKPATTRHQQSIFDTDDYQLEDYNPSKVITKSPVQKSKHPRILHRGEVYVLNNPKNKVSNEGDIKECVIIIQNDYANSVSDDSIALYCSSQAENVSSTTFSFRLSESTLHDYLFQRVETFDCCTFVVKCIKGVKRHSLGKYLGTLKSRFMNALQPTIDYHLGLKRSRMVNLAQLQIISTVDTNELLELARSNATIEDKVTGFLKMFNFDFTLNGVSYLRDAIICATQLTNYRLEDLVSKVTREENIDDDEVSRLIIARIKERFHLKKAPTMSFIRLIDNLSRREVINYGDNREGFCFDLGTTLNFNQLELLDTVSFGEVFKISRSPFSDDKKVERYLTLFGFDLEKCGVNYIRDAILIARQMTHEYCLERLFKK